MIPERPSTTTRAPGAAGLPRARELLVVCAVLGLLQAPGSAAILALRYDRTSIEHGQWWRALTAHFVHLDWGHWAMNVAGLVGLWWLYVVQASRTQWLAVVAASGLMISLALYVRDPAVDWYVGLSGVLHALWAAAAVAMWRTSRVEAAGALALLIAKLVFEYVHGPLSGGPGSTLPVVSAAHRYGAAAGLLCALSLRLWRKPL